MELLSVVAAHGEDIQMTAAHREVMGLVPVTVIGGDLKQIKRQQHQHTWVQLIHTLLFHSLEVSPLH